MTFPPYNHLKVERKWQKEWEKKKPFKAKDTSRKEKFYGLIEFPYPSGDGLHVGHVRSNTAMDIIARKRRAEGYEVLYPIGWDAFGLPTENYAIKTGIAPDKVTKKNTDTFRRQLKALGFSFDWDREVNTTDPAYYKWTQWIFLQLFKKGLAYKKKMAINWCPKDKIGLANEEVINGTCERCGTEVEQREKEQWMLAITKYAGRLDKDLDDVDFLPKVKLQQRNWIGASEGSSIPFLIVAGTTQHTVQVFTTRADTLFGVTYLVLSPEHPLLSTIISSASNRQDIEAYVIAARKKDVTDRTAADKEKTGVQIQGVAAINPVNKERIPVYIADYVLSDYGTGAVMAVPAHDERDFAFAKKYNIPIRQVIAPKFIDPLHPPQNGKKVVRRHTMHAIVRRKDGKFLVLKWKGAAWGKNPPKTFIIGGVEEGENIIEAAKREIHEETGYNDLVLTGTSNTEIHTEYFAAHKDENRYSIIKALYFELQSEAKDPISVEENEKHEVLWISESDVLSFLNIADGPFVWNRYKIGEKAYVGDGTLINSGTYDGMKAADAIKKITEAVGGEIVTTYKLRDWVFSRQRYWGEPIPLVFCESCKKNTGEGWVPVPEKDLPVKLPKVARYQPTDTGESPLAPIKKWVETKCPVCKGPARRETDTMPNWAGSSWYFLRYIDPKNKKVFADPKKLAHWLPVDWYNGGMEHTTLHLLYSRFWHKFLFDLGLVQTHEPYQKRTSHGLILAEGGVKMSKSKGNVVNPDTIVQTVGADSLRLYEMFMGPFDQAIAWSPDGVVGTRRFLERVWKYAEPYADKKYKPIASSRTISVINDTVKKVSHDIETMNFNTAVSALMIALNTLEKEQGDRETFAIFLKLLSPFAPHMTEELWTMLGYKGSVHAHSWPMFDADKVQKQSVKLVVQINGKVRASFHPTDQDNEAKTVAEATNLPEVAKWLLGKKIQKTIVIPEKIVSIVAVDG